MKRHLFLFCFISSILIFRPEQIVSRFFPTLAGAAQAQGWTEPELPRVYLDTRYPTVNGATVSVASGGNLQAALNAALPGTEIVLEAGATFTGNFTLPAKAGQGWIVIRTSRPDRMPAEGNRVDPASHAAYMPKIVTANSIAAVTALAGAHHYRFVGIEFAATGSLSYNVIRLGNDSETDAGRQPGDIVIDRCYIHGHTTGDLRRGITLNSRSTAVIDSHISEVHQLGADTQAIGGWNGPGPFKIVNNYLEAAGENVMIGGADPAISNMVPSDIEIRRNHIAKPLRWKSSIIEKPVIAQAVASTGGSLAPGTNCYYRIVARGRIGYSATASSASSDEIGVLLSAGQSSVQLSWSASEHATSYRVYRSTDRQAWHYYDVTGTSYTDTGASPTGGTTTTPSSVGTRWTVKNLFELKSARRVLIDGNLFENSWKHAQTGYAILIKSTNPDGGAPWNVTEDVTFTNNLVRHAGIGISIIGRDSSDTFEFTRKIKIENNLFDDIDGARWNSNGNAIQLLAGNTPAGGAPCLPSDIIINHNTFFGSGYILVDGPSNGSGLGFRFTNNIIKTSSYGIKGSGTPSGDGTISAYFTAPVWDKNVFIGARSSYFSTYRGDNYFHTDPNTVGFVSFPQGQANYQNYGLTAGSPYSATGLHPAGDRKDRGVDIVALFMALSPVKSPPFRVSGDVVLYASEAGVRVGNWAVVSDSTAAGGARLHNPNASAARVNTPLASSLNYFEMTFDAKAGRPYRLWLRGKADNNGWANDSVWVQFSASVNASGAPVSRIGTASAEPVNLEDCSGCGLSGWGWQDNGYGSGVMGPLIYFETSGTQTIRVQVREDGFSIDQIVLSPETYLNSSPGSLKNDTTILPRP
jgi:hypothetical protein